ncbi:hypothetical protein BDQ17DRAFT_1414771 [Cyathus striatus]|nr:hypothetical protein BDQ17DRAFT_1414771 [Cyathus striatus]
MSLTLRTEDLHRYCISADFSGSKNGSISLALKPSLDAECSPLSQCLEASRTMIHFETILEDGCYKLLIFASFEEVGADTTAENVGLGASSSTGGTVSVIRSDQLNSLILGDHNGLATGNSMQQLTSDWMQHGVGFGADSSAGFLDFSNPEAWGIEHPLNKGIWEDLSSEGVPEGSLDEGSSPTPSTPSHSVSSCEDSSSSISQNGNRRPRRLSCLHSGCNRRFMSEYTRKLHMGTHKPKTRYTCQMGCDETFSRQHDRLRHEVAIHGRQVEWLCERCRRFFSCQGTLDKHKCSGNAREIATRHILPKV